jgi:hypothetical protein
VCVFTFASLSVTVLPLFLEEQILGFEVAVTGMVAGLTLAVGAAVQRPLVRFAPTTSAPWGVAAGSAGLLVALAAAATGAWALILPAAALFGVGYGCCLAAGLTATERLAAPAERGALTATFYACAYLGFAAPYAVALVARTTGFATPLTVLAAGTVALGVWLAAGAGRRALAAHPHA